MLADDLPGRFDYLFEPLEVDELAGNGDVDSRQVTAQPEDNNPWIRRLVLAGVVLATLGLAAATVMVLLQPAQPAQEPVTIASEPREPMPPSPATRAPISVSPESRTPFPNQAPPPTTINAAGCSAEIFS
jgi:hypothetical protein